MSGDVAIVERVLTILEERGAGSYGGEAVTQLEHALQAAALASHEAAPDALVAAALLHDIGHLLDDADDVPSMPGDDRHEVRSAEFLRGAFVEAVVAPVALHVAAKRYLCAIDPAYHAGLSAASVRSLAHQGGPLTPAECEQFRRQAYWDAAVRVRRWDDLAKVPGRITPSLASYRGPLERSLRRPAIVG